MRLLAAAAMCAASHAASAVVSASGVFPSLTVRASTAPNRSECGHGALMAWADRLYTVSYLSVANAGSGTGLYEIDENMTQTMIAPHNSTYANRMLVPKANVIVIGPFVIDASRNVRVLESLMHVRIGGMAEHLFFPESMVYMLGMDGALFECDIVSSLNCTQLFDLVTALDIPASAGEQPHFKAAHTMSGLLWVASNTMEQADGLGLAHGGRLATWDGKSANWTIIARTAYVEVTGRHNMGCAVFALGFDSNSVILTVVDNGCDDPSYDKQLQHYRLPKASHAYDHLWTTEWPRIREVETERYLMDMHGMFYELSPLVWGGAVWGVKPISQHLRMVPDFASFRGFLVLGGNQVSSIFDNNWVTGQSQSGLWLGKTDDLWGFGKPQGWGAVWRNTPAVVSADPAAVVSDPFLMTGFDRKVLHLRCDSADQATNNCSLVSFAIDVDFTGSAGHIGATGSVEPWSTLDVVALSSAYAAYLFPPGFSAHWVRVCAVKTGSDPSPISVNLTAHFTYT
jgi:hypothetical protein